MSAEFSRGESCPLERGNEGLEFNNVTVDGGAKSTMSAIDQDALRFSFRARPERLHETQEKRQAILKHPSRNLRAIEAHFKGAGIFGCDQ